MHNAEEFEAHQWGGTYLMVCLKKVIKPILETLHVLRH